MSLPILKIHLFLYLLLCFALLSVFWNRVYPISSGCPGMHSVDLACFNLRRSTCLSAEIKWKRFQSCLYFVCICLSTVPSEARRWPWIPWNWSYRQMWSAFWYLELNPGPLKKSRPCFYPWFQVSVSHLSWNKSGSKERWILLMSSFSPFLSGWDLCHGRLSQSGCAFPKPLTKEQVRKMMSCVLLIPIRLTILTLANLKKWYLCD